jgi:hypothetical protein
MHLDIVYTPTLSVYESNKVKTTYNLETEGVQIFYADYS